MDKEYFKEKEGKVELLVRGRKKPEIVAVKGYFKAGDFKQQMRRLKDAQAMH